MDILSILFAVIIFLESHLLFSYTVIFLVAYFETLVSIEVFAYGEIFFVVAAVLAGVGIFDVWVVTLALLVGAVLGDSSSFAIGRRYHTLILDKGSKFFNSRKHQKSKRSFEEYGVKSLFLARLFRPISPVTHLWAGAHKTPYQKFLIYDIPGVIVGVGKFVLAGYFLGSNYQEILTFVQEYSATIIFISIFLLVAYYITSRVAPGALKQTVLFWRHEKRKLLRKMLKYTAYYMLMFVLFYIFSLYLLFFLRTTKQPSVPVPLPVYHTLSEAVGGLNFVAYADKTSSHPVQPVNIIIATSADISEVFRSSSWVHDVIFSKENLTPEEFYFLWKKHTPPVSDLYVDGVAQDVAFQNSSESSLRRLHVRFWKIGFLGDGSTALYLGSVSYDTGLGISSYDKFFVPLHEIDPDVDRARESMLKMFLDARVPIEYTYEPLGTPILKTHNEDTQYRTDGRILFLQY